MKEVTDAERQNGAISAANGEHTARGVTRDRTMVGVF
jgi:hypothetical protein